ncbi:sensor histidine kinase [Amycolatopsis keratiniphila]|uniref:histidine kinase n=1 Tax=Amycolatopsis keratiniphila subsp. keratiniphila TaxID=227715 RepID=A0A1W2LQ52_9PSEU|nr:sensor histidine kinase [Amycolatopsis keratiniphila]OLZ56072.1 sensor histidine kinase [Amycolatopsis keratiniphila subsp. nogabecina]ONF66138.1 sensor histidine kinase [Amycolatopsis keratiniphila subsp. keratiniphila]SDU51611.1 Histidine kinase-, DNA gyrase B-, and HSP90-like ATPase [Amycolatopsis keratiniphila]
MRRYLRKALRGTLGLAIGAMTAVAEAFYVLFGTLALTVPALRQPVFAGARVLSEVERRRLEKYFGEENATNYTDRRAMAYLVPRSVIGLLCAAIFILILLGAGSAVIIAAQLFEGQSPGGGAPADWYDPVTTVLFGGLLVFLSLQGLIGAATLDARLAKRFFGPSKSEQLRRRLSELTTSRAEVVEAVNGERRRIERDLHDGVQQRLVALGMLLGRARRATDPEHASELLRQAHEESQRALVDLREVSWRVYPIALDADGLHPALEALAERSGIPVHLRVDLAERPPAAIETVVYFVASEAVTNTIKHAAATRIDIEVERDGDRVRVRITDDGTGGARESGGGLSGLAMRVAAADGRFTVDSPLGGPTVVTAVLPCE